MALLPLNPLLTLVDLYIDHLLLEGSTIGGELLVLRTQPYAHIPQVVIQHIYTLTEKEFYFL